MELDADEDHKMMKFPVELIFFLQGRSDPLFACTDVEMLLDTFESFTEEAVMEYVTDFILSCVLEPLDTRAEHRMVFYDQTGCHLVVVTREVQAVKVMPPTLDKVKEIIELAMEDD